MQQHVLKDVLLQEAIAKARIGVKKQEAKAPLCVQ